MNLKSILLCMLMLPLAITAASAQNATSDKIKPRWIHKLPKATNDTFSYELITTSSASLNAARDNALTELISSTGLANGVVVSSEWHSNEQLSQVWENGKLAERITNDAQTITSTKGEEVKLYISNIDEYWRRDKQGIYHLTRLYAKSRVGATARFDNVELTTKYGMRGLWRSMIIPGWGQFHKGCNLKGGLILGGSAALATGIIYTETMRNDYMRKINTTHSAEHKLTYATRSDNFAMGRNICIGALGALYIYNLIDAIAAPGARYVKIKRGHKGASYAFAPTVVDGENPAVAMAIMF